MKAPQVVYVTYIRTTAQKLWDALTRGEFMAKYWHARIRSTWKVGAPVETFTRQGKPDWVGKVLLCEPPRRLSYTFQILGYQKRSSRVLFEIEPAGSAVKLTLSHDRIEARRRLAGVLLEPEVVPGNRPGNERGGAVILAPYQDASMGTGESRP